jgi:glycosyltransferase involved in cell wall biosynthesis
MRIALVSDYYLPTLGGVQTVVKAQLEGLTRAGHEATVFAPLAEESGSDDVVALRAARHFHPDGYPFTWPPRSAIALLEHEFVRRRIDVVHVHSEMFAALAGMRAARTLGLPIVFTVHGRVDVYSVNVLPIPSLSTALLAGIHGRYVSHAHTPVRSDRPHTRTVAARRMWRLMVSQANAATRVAVPSAHLAAKLVDLGVTSPVTVVPNAIEDSVIESLGPPVVRTRREGESLRVMWCGRVSPEKRPGVFVDAATRFAPDVTSDMYGDGVSRAAVKAAVRAMAVTWHGAVPQGEVLAAMSDHHVFVSSSLDFDNQPMVMLEAIAAGLPIVYCDPDLAETVPPLGSRLTVTPDADGVAQAIERIRTEPGLLSSLSAATIAWRKAVSIDAHVSALLEVYETSLS